MAHKAVVIAAGMPLHYDPIDPLDGTISTGDPDGWASGFAIADAVVGVMLTVLGVYQELDGVRAATGWKKAFMIGNTAVLAGVSLTGAGISAAGGADTIPVTTVIGAAGVVIATPAFLAMYGICGAGLVSAFPTIVGFKDSSMLALHDATISSLFGTASLEGKQLELHARDSIEIGVHTSGVNGPIEIEGSELHIEARARRKRPPPPPKQSAPTVPLAPQPPAPPAQPGHIHVEAGRAINLEAADKITIEVGHYRVEIKPDGIRIGHEEKENAFINIKGTRINLATGEGDEAAEAELFGDTAAIYSGGSKASGIVLKEDGIKLKSLELAVKAGGNIKLASDGMIKIG
jgi:hypothetical protein